MVIEKFAAIITVQFLDWEGQTGKHAPEAFLHAELATPEDGHSLTPAGGNINQLQGIDEVARGLWATMMDQIDLEVARLSLIPGNDAHGNGFGDAVGVLRSLARQARSIQREAREAALNAGDANLASGSAPRR